VIPSGVEKKDITFKIIKNNFYIKLPRKVLSMQTVIYLLPSKPGKKGVNYPKSIFKVKVIYQQAFEKAVDIKTD
jgi:HSP20 family protein